MTYVRNIMILVLLTCLFAEIQSAQAQNSSNNSKPYRIKIKFLEKKRQSQEGILLKTTDSTLVLISDTGHYFFKRGQKYNEFIIPYNGIKEIKIWRKHKVFRSMAIGAGSGFVILSGSVLISNNKDVDPFVRQLQYALVTAATIYGGIGGGVIGLFKKKLEIDGDQDKFKILKLELVNKSLLNVN